VAVVTRVAALAGVLPSAWTWRHAIMTGCILGGSSSIVILPAMARANVSGAIADLVNLESALTDALCVVSTAAIVGVMVSGGAGSPIVALVKSFGLGAATGVGAGFAWLLVLRLLHKSEHGYIFTLSALLCLYVVVSHTGGSAALAILAFAIVLGNARDIMKALHFSEDVSLGEDVQGVHHNIAFIVKSFFFTFIGLMLGPPWPVLALGVLIGIALYAARIPAVRISALGSDLDRRGRRIVAVCLPRGMAAGVLATMPMAAGVPGTDDLPSLVFATVVTTIAIFAVGLPLVRRAPVVASAPSLLPS